MANKSKDVKMSPAGENDKISFRGLEFSNVIEKEKFETKTSRKGVKIEILSTELTENMTIKAQNDTEKDLEARRKQPQFNPKLISFEKKAKQIKEKRQNSDEDRAM